MEENIGGLSLLLLLIVIGTSIWVYFDAKSIGIKKGQIKGFLDLGPGGWLGACLLLWILCFPVYLAKRGEYKRINQITANNNKTAQEAITRCPFCKEEIQEGAIKCKHCGSMMGGQGSVSVPPASPSPAASAVTDEEFSAFIGQNVLKYTAKFRKFNIQGVDNFAATWNWAAFFFPWLWFLYRKMYLWALGSFVLGAVSLFLANIAWGIAGNYIYYKHAKKKISELKSRIPTVNATILSEVGGVHKWIKILGAVILAIILAAIILAVAIPAYTAYHQQAKIKAVKENFDVAVRYTQAESSKKLYDINNVTTDVVGVLNTGNKKSPFDNKLSAFISGTSVGPGQVAISVRNIRDNADSTITISADITGDGISDETLSLTDEGAGVAIKESHKVSSDVAASVDVDNTEKSGPCKGLDLSITADLSNCLGIKYEIADKELNQIYKELMTNLPESRKTELKREQIAWIKQKESKCAEAGKEFEGGTFQTITESDCHVQMTEERVKYLKNFK